MKPRRAAKGEGYTVRRDGRKLLKTTVLEEEVQAIQQQYEELLQQNEVLRQKEAMQMALLESYEAGLQHLGTIVATQTNTAPRGSDVEQSLVNAAVLDMQALELMQVLKPHDSSQNYGHSQNLAQQQQQQHEHKCYQNSTESSSSMSASAATSSTCDSGGSGRDAPSAATQNRMKSMFESMTPSDIQSLTGLSLSDLAERFRCLFRKLETAYITAKEPGNASCQAVADAVHQYGTMCVMSLLADEDRHLWLVGLNLESMQHEAPPATLWAEVIQAAHLQLEQKAVLAKAFHCFDQQKALLLQKQQETMEQLKSIIGTVPMPQHLLSSYAGLSSAAAGKYSGTAHISELVGAPALPESATVVGSDGVKQEGTSTLSTQVQVQGTVAPYIKQEAVDIKQEAVDIEQDPVEMHQQAGVSAHLEQEAVVAVATAAGVDTSAAAGACFSSEQCTTPDRSQQHRSTQQLGDPMDRQHQGSPGTAGSDGHPLDNSSIQPDALRGDREPQILSVDESQHAEELLQGLIRTASLLKQHSRRLTVCWINLLTDMQLAAATLKAYPFFINIPEVCAHIAQAHELLGAPTASALTPKTSPKRF